MSKPYLFHLKSAANLKTTNEAVRAGFAALAVENHRRATPYVEQARALKHAASQAKHPVELLEIPGIQSALVPVSRVNFVEELVFRFLLTRIWAATAVKGAKKPPIDRRQEPAWHEPNTLLKTFTVLNISRGSSPVLALGIPHQID